MGKQGADADPWPCSQRDMMQLHQAGWLFSDMREKMADRVFEDVFGTKELHSSKDGFTLQRPTTGELGRSPNDHFDQGLGKRGLQCIQGSVALTDQDYEDGCFLCWPRSHRLHDEMMEWRGSKNGREDFVILTRDEHHWLESKGIRPKRVPVQRGDVILWRSDLVHKGAPPIGRRDNFRAVVYICMLPAALTPESVYKDKLRAYKRIETGSHWPNREEWFKPRRGSAQTPYFRKPPSLTLRQQELYGLVRYSTTPMRASPSVGSEPQDATHSRSTSAGSIGISAAAAAAAAAIGKAAEKTTRRWTRSSAPHEETSAADIPRKSQSSAEPAAAAAPALPVEISSAMRQEGIMEKALGSGPSQAFKDVRRVEKAIREIEALEKKQETGDKLQQNQIIKIQRKQKCIEELRSFKAALAGEGGA